jgi:phosphoribosyl 1,2-cyclic phosphodiesterase
MRPQPLPQNCCPLPAVCRKVRRVSVRLTILGSGSGGNCAYLETSQTRILIDAGFSCRQIRERLARIGRTPESLQAILITHEHTDHTQGLTRLSAKLQIPVYCNRLTQDAVQRQLEAAFPCHIFETGSSFEIGDVLVDTFPVPHDAQDPVGYVLRTPTAKLGFLTDLGHATRLVLERVRGANVLVLEANHDVKLLQNDPHRPWSVKQRILSRHGHLSNDAAAQVAQDVVSAELQHLYLGHLSRECNRPDLALGAVQGRLQDLGAAHVRVECTSQTVPCPTLAFGEVAAVAAPL